MRRRRRTVCLFRSTSMIFCYVCLSAFLSESTSHEERIENRIQRTKEETSADDAELTSVTTKWHHLFYGRKENSDKGMEWRDTIEDNGHTEKQEVTSYAEKRDFSIKHDERITSQGMNILEGRDFPRGSKPGSRSGKKGFLNESYRESNVLSRLADRGAANTRGHRKRRSDTSIEFETLEDLFGDALIFSERALDSDLKKSMAGVRVEAENEQLNFDADQEAMEAVEEENLEKRDANEVVISKKLMKDMEDMTFSRALEYVEKNHLDTIKPIHEKSVMSLNITNALNATQNNTFNASMNTTNALEATQNNTFNASMNTTNALDATQNNTFNASMNTTNALDATQNNRLNASLTVAPNIGIKPNYEKNNTVMQKNLERIEENTNANGTLLWKGQEENKEKGNYALLLAKNAEKKKEEEKKEKEKKEEEKKENEKKEKEKKEKEKTEEENKAKEKKEKEKKEEEKKEEEKKENEKKEEEKKTKEKKEKEKKEEEKKEKEKKEKEKKEKKEEEIKAKKKENEEKEEERKEKEKKEKQRLEEWNKEKEKKHGWSRAWSTKKKERKKIKQVGKDQRREYEEKNLEYANYALRRKAAREKLLQRVKAKYKKAQEKSKKSKKKVKKKLKKLKKLKKASLIKIRKRKS